MQKLKNKKVIILFGGWACALVLIFSFTCASFAKYVGGKSTENNAGVASFPCSIQVDAGVSTPLFLNSDYATYIYGDGETETVINPPQTIDFSVSNYIGDYVAEVAVNYSLVFYIPVVFSKVATVQVTKDDDTSAVTPLYVLDKFLDAAKEKVGSTNSVYVNTTPVTRTTTTTTVTDSEGNTTETKKTEYGYYNVSTKLQDSYIADEETHFTTITTTSNEDGTTTENDDGTTTVENGTTTENDDGTTTENDDGTTTVKNGTTTVKETESTYGAVEGAAQQIFECTGVETKDGEVTSASFKATEKATDDTDKVTDKVTGTVTVEKVTMSSTVVRGYSTDKDGSRLANIYLTKTEDVAYYKFTIYHASFQTLPAGTKTARSYGLRMSLTKGISDTDNPIDTDYNTDVPWTKFLETTTDETTGAKLYNVTTTDGWKVSVGTDNSITLTYGTGDNATTYSNVKVDPLDEKTYPCRLNALFEQVTGS